MTAKLQVALKKITEYLLNPAHRVGGHKAKLFIRYGFSRERPKELVVALIQHYKSNPISNSRRGKYGFTNCRVDGPMKTPSGRIVNLRSCWYFSDVDPTVRLSSAWIEKSKSSSKED
jgi:hypothetical protein